MFVAPLTLPESSVPPRRRALTRRALQSASSARNEVGAASSATAFLIVWIGIGIGVLACTPAARGSVMLGATLPFWFVVAPLIDLAWLWRAQLVRLLRAPRPRRHIGVARFRRTDPLSRRAR